MKQEQILSVLYDLALTASGETRVAPLLSRMTQRLLYHSAFSCGFFFSYSDQKENNRNSETIDAIIETALCSRQLNLTEGQTIKVPRIFSACEAKIISDKELINTIFSNNNKYNTVLILPVPGHGAFVLLSQTDQDQALPLTRIFTPVLDNFAKNLSLCKQNEEVTHALEREVEERKKAERGLAQFKKTMDMTHDCIFVIDPESLRFIYCNHGAVQQTGYSMEELLAMTPADLDPNNDIDAIRNMMNRVMNRSDI
ncbi:MAG TPA: PAS domain S-box protein, partial [Candidatus Tenderia electrophaga]|nr:PAS domain S-box protein [Candidatus Tenderia electrophaga]